MTMESLLKVNEIVAAALEAEGVDLALGMLTLDLGLLLGVRDQVSQVVHEVLMGFLDASLGDAEDALPVLPLLTLGLLISECSQLVLGVFHLFSLFDIVILVLIGLRLLLFTGLTTLLLLLELLLLLLVHVGDRVIINLLALAHLVVLIGQLHSKVCRDLSFHLFL